VAYSVIPRKTESRRHARYPLHGMIRILWEDNGRERVSNAMVVNKSANGAKLRVDERIPVRSYVTCNDEALGIVGRASVRYCIYSKGKYEIGLEFGDGAASGFIKRP
jgi:hypothetical protein